MHIGVIGLGKLGLPLALTFASVGNTVLVYDESEHVESAVRSRTCHIDEPGMAKFLSEYTLEWTHPEDMAKIADIVFIVVPTPSFPDGEFDDMHVCDALHSMGHHDESDDVVAVVVSTVSPGTLTKSVAPLAKRHGVRLAYAPTLIALGTVYRDLTLPDAMIIGVDPLETVAGNTTAAALRTIAPTAPIVHTDLETAAIAKLAT